MPDTEALGLPRHLRIREIDDAPESVVPQLELEVFAADRVRQRVELAERVVREVLLDAVGTPRMREPPRPVRVPRGDGQLAGMVRLREPPEEIVVRGGLVAADRPADLVAKPVVRERRRARVWIAHPRSPPALIVVNRDRVAAGIGDMVELIERAIAEDGRKPRVPRVFNTPDHAPIEIMYRFAIGERVRPR